MKSVLIVFLSLSFYSFTQNQAELVKPWRDNFFFSMSIFSDNGQYALLTDCQSPDYGNGQSKSLLVDLKNKRVIKSISDEEFYLEPPEYDSQLIGFNRFSLSNNGKYLAAFSYMSYNPKAHIINLNDLSDHKTIIFKEKTQLSSPQFKFSENDSLLIIYNKDNYTTYLTDVRSGKIVDEIKSEDYVDKIWVQEGKIFQKIDSEDQGIIRVYKLDQLVLIDEILVPSKWNYQTSTKEFFTKNFFVQQREDEDNKALFVRMVNLQNKEIIKFDKRISRMERKMRRGIDYFELIDVDHNPAGHKVCFTFQFYLNESIDSQIWCYDLKEEDLKKISDNPIWFDTGLDEDPISIPEKDVVFYLAGEYIGKQINKSIPYWMGFNNNKTNYKGYGLAKTQEIDFAKQRGSLILFGSILWNKGGSFFTEIDLKTGEVLDTVFRNLKSDDPNYTISNVNEHYINEYFPKYSGIEENHNYHDDTIQQLYYENDPKNIISSVLVKSEDQHVLWNDSDKKTDFFNFKKPKAERKVSQFLTLQGEYIFLTPDRYYMVSSELRNEIYFQMNLKTYPLEQFDLKYNRPDIILDRLGYADSSLIAAYHAAYKKRLKKMGFTEDMLEDDFHLPEIKIENFEKMPTIIDEDNIDLNLHLEDSKYKLDRINIWVNDVAIYGTDGISLRELDTQKLDKTIKVDLAKGKNKVQVSVLNQAGAESYKETFEVECSVGKKKPNLYLITIGEGEFKQADFNLTYAAKDAKDVAALFPKSKVYDEVFSKTLTNDQVTRENVVGLKSFLEKADINDHVMIFLAGHGVLSADLDYYLATYDMDFSAPEKRGLMYEDLEGLLDGIKPLKKTLILDACHSGEIDKEEVELASAENTFKGDVQFRSVGKSVKSKLGSQNTLELTKSLFTDLRKGTGATVISSAGGMEFAMEGDDWNNGLFTYALLNGIESGEADMNGDKEIWLSELKEYVGQKVTELSNGKQQPTSRIENQTVDFRVW